MLFDCPGQVELFTHHSSLRNCFFQLQKFGYRVCFPIFPFRTHAARTDADICPFMQLVALHLTDSYALTLPSLYISTLILSLRAMLQMDLPHLNVLTKIDKIASYGPLPFDLEFYTEARDLSDILPHLAKENPIMQHPKFQGLNTAVVELVEDFGLVGFETLAVEDKKSMMSLLQSIDRAGGYAFGGAEGANDTIWQVAMREGVGSMNIRDVQERWIDRKEEFDELERREREEDAATGKTPSLTSDGSGEEDSEVEEMRRDMADNGIKVVRR